MFVDFRHGGSRERLVGEDVFEAGFVEGDVGFAGFEGVGEERLAGGSLGDYKGRWHRCRWWVEG